MKTVNRALAALGGIDLLVFTDDIGQHNWLLREKVCLNMAWCGVELDLRANRQASGDEISVLSAPRSKAEILIVPTEEELIICKEGMKLAGDKICNS